MSSASVLREGAAEARRRERDAPRARDRDNPSLYDAIELDPVVPIADDIKRALVRDLRRPIRRALHPTIRVLVTFAIHVILFVKRLVPFRLAWLGALSASTAWISKRFASPEAQQILLRHFVIETQLANFVARNASAGRAPEYDLMPTHVSQLGDHNGLNAIALHDANIMNLFIDLGTLPDVDVDTRRPLGELDFSMLEMPALQLETRSQWLNFDLPSVLYISALMIALFFDDETLERAVNSFQLDESLLTAIANLTGEEPLRALAPVKFTHWLGTPTGDPARDLHWHFLLHEQTYERLLRLKRRQQAERAAA
jgi:hypothetical protein